MVSYHSLLIHSDLSVLPLIIAQPLAGLREQLERVGDCLAHEAVLLLAFDPLLEPSAKDESWNENREKPEA